MSNEIARISGAYYSGRQVCGVSAVRFNSSIHEGSAAQLT
jgi:hypothetical protein